MDSNAIITAVEDHALRLGWFDSVNMHEPDSPPGYDMTYAIWVQSITAVPDASGLNSTTARLVLGARLYLRLDAGQRDQTDSKLLKAVDALMGAYSGDFTLGGLVRNVDLLGAHGEPLSGEAGYVTMDDEQEFRVFTLAVPLIINDAWTQGA
jgi:hypothetical protein